MPREKKNRFLCFLWHCQWGTSSWGKCFLHPLCLPRVSFNNLILKLISMILWEKLVYHLKELNTTTRYMTLSCGVCCVHVGVRSLGVMTGRCRQRHRQIQTCQMFRLKSLRRSPNMNKIKQISAVIFGGDWADKRHSWNSHSHAGSPTENLRFCCNAGFDGQFSNS